LSKFSIGFLYRGKIAELSTKFGEDNIIKLARDNFESALTIFEDINHLMG